jgi:hypothetical protein
LALTLVSAVFAIGVVAGAESYVNRSSVVVRHENGSSAIATQIVIFVAALVIVVGTRYKRSRSTSPLRHQVWSSAFSKESMSRVRQTIQLKKGFSLVNLARIPTSLLLILLMLYWPFRMGQQLIGGLDPNFNVNAWGGPTYAGALLAHWLDCILAFYALAFILRGVVVKPRFPVILC